jgi:hypothetical protein
MKISNTQALVGLVIVSFGVIIFAHEWRQWAQGPQHAGAIPVAGQSPDKVLARMVNDPATRGSRQEITRLNTFGGTVDPITFVSGPITADNQRNVYVLKLKITNDPLTNDPWSFGPPILTITVP